jgi:uncharacterized membrane protein YozB (DUF420 family)
VIDPSSAHLWWHALPRVNASLNGASAVMLMTGFVMIKNQRVKAHATMMISALVTSAAFLTCYIVYHTMKARHGELVTTFPPSSWRPYYLSLLISHTILAVVILPLVLGSFWLAWRRRWSTHKKLSSFTFPLWLYVSVTGVVVYWMLYYLAPTLR